MRYEFTKFEYKSNIWNKPNKIKPKLNRLAQQLPRPATRTPAHAPARPRTRRGPLTRAARGRLPPARAADGVTPRVRERTGEGRKATTVACRRWQLRRGHGYQRVHLTRAHLGVPLIATISVPREDGGGHGSARTRVGQLRRHHGPISLPYEHQHP
jgi:hypothetical protein